MFRISCRLAFAVAVLPFLSLRAEEDKGKEIFNGKDLDGWVA